MTLRSGMADLITDLRLLTDTAENDYSVNGSLYWSDLQLQKVLDNHRTDLKWYEMTAIQEADLSYLDYAIEGYGNFEQTTGGTAIFIIQDVAGAAVTSPSYSVDYSRGVVTFASDTEGTTYWVTGRSFDIQSAAAEVWRAKVSHYARAVNFSTDNHNISREQLYTHAKEMAEYYEQQGSGGITSVVTFRSDTDA